MPIPTPVGGLTRGIMQGFQMGSQVNADIQSRKRTKAYEDQVAQQKVRDELSELRTNVSIVSDPLQPEEFSLKIYNEKIAPKYNLPELTELPKSVKGTIDAMNKLLDSNLPVDEKLKRMPGFQADFIRKLGKDDIAKPAIEKLEQQRKERFNADVNVFLKARLGQDLTPEEVSRTAQLMNEAKNDEGVYMGNVSLAVQEAAIKLGGQSLDPYANLSVGVRDQLAAQSNPKVAEAISANQALKAEQEGEQGGLPKSLIKPVADAKVSMDAIDKVMEYFTKDKKGVGNEYVGMIQGRIGGYKSKAGKITQDEAEFRTRVNLMKIELRKFYFGTAQSKQELEGSLEAIPELNMSDTQFAAALKVHRDKVTTWLKEIENGARVPGKIKETPENDFSGMSDEEFSKTYLR